MKRPEQSEQELAVAEIQGLYGPFTFTERLLQKIWLRGEFDAAHAVTEDGRPVRIVHPGRWNLLGGPDFCQARLVLGGEDLAGDVELHLHAGDWAAHAHAMDAAYAQVMLHVVLFPPAPGEVARRPDGRALPTLVLLPLLLHDLEEYAAEDAVELLASRTDWRATEELARLPGVEVRAVLLAEAAERWRQKVRFARRRIARLGWTEACHHAALEILGYRFNRVPMLKTAIRAPLTAWANGAADLGELFAAEACSWSLQGVRPANHPRTRLRQYAAWVQARPAWPEQLVSLAGTLNLSPGEDPAASTSLVRRRAALPALRARLATEIIADAIGSTRLDNLVCDGFLPMLAARTERELFPLWFHWRVGDLPPRLLLVLKSLAVFDGRAQPACHGFAQGLLGWMLAREYGGSGQQVEHHHRDERPHDN